MKSIELLAPARNAECGIEAIRCGADAVYIGAQAFGARAEATNPTNDIAELVRYAHQFGAKVYVALNTIIYEHELQRVKQLALQLAEIGIDALITQDVALLQMNLPIPLHASTQMDNRTPEQVKFLHECGFPRAILARETGISDIRKIHAACPEIELEAFVHGALCVSLSGRCYASQHCFGRSANRGECAQFCRLAFNLEDANHNVILEDKHLLSLKDMNRSNDLEEMIDAGVMSFKIEGRLKDISYVKNITSYYRQKIDKILQHRPDLCRASYGNSNTHFTADPQKSFNRGFTTYFLHERTKDIFSFQTPKALGEPVGEVKEIKGNCIKVTGVAAFHNGDGLCFFDRNQKLQGFRVNRVQNNILYPSIMPKGLMPRMPLFRNHDEEFVKQLTKTQAERFLYVDILCKETNEGFALSMHDEMGKEASISFVCNKEEARTPQTERQKAELSKLGDTIYKVRSVELAFTGNYFIPASTLSDWRRQVVNLLQEATQKNTTTGPKTDSNLSAPSTPAKNTDTAVPNGSTLSYMYNVANSMAENFYVQHGATSIQKAYEIVPPKEAVIMTCKHCLRYAMGFCKKEKHTYQDPLQEPLFLTLPDGKRFRLNFDCKNCLMEVYATEN